MRRQARQTSVSPRYYRLPFQPCLWTSLLSLAVQRNSFSMLPTVPSSPSPTISHAPLSLRPLQLHLLLLLLLLLYLIHPLLLPLLLEGCLTLLP
ncbi:UNVERIFIED_CONTAM: transmembrane protein, putative [Hammondia hammondi]|eukprot:XP_008884234.1 transmembrane protein, putative [Hammondia hammondi]